MSLRQVFRSKLKSLERSSDKGEEKTTEGPSSKSPTIEDIKESDALIPVEPSTSAASDLASIESDSLRDLDDKNVYELQLTQLQEQLVAAMIENQNLSLELKSFKEENQIEKILQELEYEREKNHQISEEMAALSKHKTQKKSSKTSVSSDKASGSSEAREDDGEWVDLAQDALDMAPPLTPEETVKRFSLRAWCVHAFYELMADFTEDAEPEGEEDKEGEQLAVKKLKDNMKRFKHGTSPIYNTIKGMYATVTWKNPAVTFIFFALYMYSVWHGWLLPVALFLMIFRLFANYLRYRGWNINIRYFTDVDSQDKEADASKESSVSEKFNLVLLVARQVQNKLGKFADSLEKIKNLLTWKQPDATLRLFLFLTVAFVFSCTLQGTTFFLLLGLWMGFKMFILEYIHSSFPRFKQRHDSVHQIWKELPTDSDLLKRYQRESIDRQVLNSEVSAVAAIQATSESMKEHDKHFCEIFELPYSEKPRPGWEAGRRCTLIDKDKSWTSSFKSGKLYLTMSFLCFERYKSTSPKNILIALSDITRLQKAKPYNWMPGGGMSVEITVVGYEKPYIFGAMLSRDECYDNIVAHGLKRNLSWAKALPEAKEASASGGNNSRRESEVKDKPEVKGDKSSEGGDAPPSPKEPTFRMSELSEDMSNYFIDDVDLSREEFLEGLSVLSESHLQL